MGNLDVPKTLIHIIWLLIIQTPQIWCLLNNKIFFQKQNLSCRRANDNEYTIQNTLRITVLCNVIAQTKQLRGQSFNVSPIALAGLYSHSDVRINLRGVLRHPSETVRSRDVQSMATSGLPQKVGEDSHSVSKDYLYYSGYSLVKQGTPSPGKMPRYCCSRQMRLGLPKPRLIFIPVSRVQPMAAQRNRLLLLKEGRIQPVTCLTVADIQLVTAQNRPTTSLQPVFRKSIPSKELPDG